MKHVISIVVFLGMISPSMGSADTRPANAEQEPALQSEAPLQTTETAEAKTPAEVGPAEETKEQPDVAQEFEELVDALSTSIMSTYQYKKNNLDQEYALRKLQLKAFGKLKELTDEIVDSELSFEEKQILLNNLTSQLNEPLPE